MSSEKTVPSTLRHQEVERGHYGRNAPIRYVPEKDPITDSLTETTTTYNTVKLPGGTKTTVRVWDGKGNNEAFLDFVIASHGLMNRCGHWKDLEDTETALCNAQEALKKAETALEAAAKEEAKWKKKDTPNAADKLARSTEKKAAAAKAVADAESLVEDAQKKFAAAAEKPFEFYGSNLSQGEQTSWDKIVKQLTESAPHTDIFGKEQLEAGGKSKDTFYDCIQLHLQSRFAFNAAECQRFYVQVGIKKSARVTVRQFYDRIHALNDAIDWLPMKYYSPQATEKTPKCAKYDDLDMVPNIMRALPESWQNDLLKSVQGNLPESTRELLPLLELIEKSPPSTAPVKSDNPKGASGGTSKKREGATVEGRIPKKARFAGKPNCKLCEKHGGKPETHATDKCRKWNADGTLKKFEKRDKDKKVHKAFAQLKSKFDENTKTLKKLLKKDSKKAKKKSKRAYVDSSDSDSDSS